MANTDIVIAVAGGVTNQVTAGNGVSMLSATGQTIAGVVSTLGPIGQTTGAIAFNPAAAMVTLIKISYDASQGYVSVGDTISVVGNGVTVAAAICAVVPGGQPIALTLGIVGRALTVSGIIASLLDVNYPLSDPPVIAPPPDIFLPDGVTNLDFWSFTGGIAPRISNRCNRYNTEALNYVAPKDPLVLDLDGNGITTTPINPNAPLLFDQDGDGTLTATGWVGAGEALVVRDLNANGRIDSGRELFGDSTLLTSGTRIGQKAANGFEALADLDSNADGQFDAADTAFTSIKLWKDANQNGISEAGELFAFADQGVASINLASTPSNIDLGGGNTQPLSGSFNRTNGQTGNAGVAELAGSLLLASNNFYRQFTNDPQVTPAAGALPQMQGSGWVQGCAWSRRRDSGMAGRLAFAIKNGAACAHQTGANSPFSVKSATRQAESIVAQGAATNRHKSKCISILSGNVNYVEAI